MGKVRKLRQKYRNLKAKDADDSNGNTVADEILQSVPTLFSKSGSLIDQLFTPDTLASSPKITSNLLKQQFAEFEERNTIATTLSVKSSIYAGMKKKTKKDLRHQLWLKKVEGIQQDKIDQASKKRRPSGAVTSDLETLSDPIAKLTSFLDDVSTEQAARIEKKAGAFRPILKQKARAKEQVINTATMAAVMNDPAYKQNPFSAIQAHLKMKYASGSS